MSGPNRRENEINEFLNRNLIVSDQNRSYLEMPCSWQLPYLILIDGYWSILWLFFTLFLVMMYHFLTGCNVDLKATKFAMRLINYVK
jgi:hypothetical protein